MPEELESSSFQLRWIGKDPHSRTVSLLVIGGIVKTSGRHRTGDGSMLVDWYTSIATDLNLNVWFDFGFGGTWCD